MSNVKPCPFCGNAMLVSCIDADTDDDFYSVECSQCGGRSNECNAEADAIEAWNQRPPEAETLIEAARRCVALNPVGSPDRIARSWLELVHAAEAYEKAKGGAG